MENNEQAWGKLLKYYRQKKKRKQEFEEQYYSLILFYAPLWGQFYEQLHAYKQASHCYKKALEASEKVRQRMSSKGVRNWS